MTTEEIYLLIILSVILLMASIIWRVSYIYRKQKADLSRAIMKVGEDHIDQEIAAMDLKQLIDHANQRNEQSANPPETKPDSSGGDTK